MPVNTYPGDSYTIELILSNAASIDRIRRLTVSAPPCFSFSSVTPFDETQNVRVGSSVKPGFYGVKVAMEPYTSN